MTYEGAWVRATRANPQAPLVAATDPQHLNPAPTPEFTNTTPAWRNSAPGPALPVDVLGADVAAAGPVPGGPVDQTPLDHSFGPGVGPGLTTLESQDQMLIWHETDTGAVAAHEWHPAVTFGEGNPGPGHALVLDETGADSPQTLQLHRTGVGQPNDPEARRASRLSRWYERYFNRPAGVDGYHRFGVQLRPITPQYARPNPAVPPVPDGSQVDSPFATAPGYLPTPPDRFVTPLMRRTPEAWDIPLTTDGTAATMAGAANEYGLTSWGL